MIKIKLNLFESILGAILFPNIGFAFTTLFLIISLIVKQKTIVYKSIIISYIICAFLMILIVTICFLANNKSAKEFILYDDRFIFLNHEYSIDKISYCEYYVCKWYAVPIAFIYKQQAAGLITFRLNTGKKIQFKIFYRDYLKIRNKFQNINLK